MTTVLDRVVALSSGERHVRTPEGAKFYGQPIGSVITRDMLSTLHAMHTLEPGQYHVKSGNRMGIAHMVVHEDGSGHYANSRGEITALTPAKVAKNLASGMSHAHVSGSQPSEAILGRSAGSSGPKLPELPRPSSAPQAQVVAPSVKYLWHGEVHEGSSNKFYESSVVHHGDDVYHVTSYGSTLPGRAPSTSVNKHPDVYSALDAHDATMDKKSKYRTNNDAFRESDHISAVQSAAGTSSVQRVSSLSPSKEKAEATAPPVSKPTPPAPPRPAPVVEAPKRKGPDTTGAERVLAQTGDASQARKKLRADNPGMGNPQSAIIVNALRKKSLISPQPQRQETRQSVSADAIKAEAPKEPVLEAPSTPEAAAKVIEKAKLPDQSKLPAPIKAAPSGSTGNVKDFLPMQYLETSTEQLPAFEADDSWWFQQKVDGMRGSLVIEPGKTPWVKAKHGGKFASTTGMKTTEPMLAALIKSGAGTPKDGPSYIIDGEILDGKFHVFDMVVPGQESMPWSERMAMAEQWVKAVNAAGVSHPVALPTARTKEEKEAMHAATFNAGQEGMVLKRKDAPYTQSNSTGSKRTNQVLKAKYTSTADVVIMSMGEGESKGQKGGTKENILFGVWDEKSGKLVPAGGCSGIGKKGKFGDFGVGDVIEVAYLWASKDGLLNQPRMVGVRRDKTKQMTSQTQFRFVDKSVLDKDKALGKK